MMLNITFEKPTGFFADIREQGSSYQLWVGGSPQTMVLFHEYHRHHLAAKGLEDFISKHVQVNCLHEINSVQ